MEVLKYFGTKNYTSRFDIIQNLSCVILGHFVSKYILGNIYSKLALVIIRNVLIYLGQNFSIIFVNNTYIEKY